MGLRFRAKQNAGHAKGGRISNPKVLWLFFAIWFWFVECAVLCFEPALPWSYRLILGAHAISMWLRSACRARPTSGSAPIPTARER